MMNYVEIYKHITNFIKNNNVNNIKHNLNMKIILRDIQNVFKKHGIIKKFEIFLNKTFT